MRKALNTTNIALLLRLDSIQFNSAVPLSSDCHSAYSIMWTIVVGNGRLLGILLEWEGLIACWHILNDSHQQRLIFLYFLFLSFIMYTSHDLPSSIFPCPVSWVPCFLSLALSMPCPEMVSSSLFWHEWARGRRPSLPRWLLGYCPVRAEPARGRVENFLLCSHRHCYCLQHKQRVKTFFRTGVVKF